MTHPLFLFVQTASFALLTGRELAKTRFEEAHFAQAAGAMNLWVLDEDLCIVRLFFWVLTFTYCLSAVWRPLSCTWIGCGCHQLRFQLLEIQ